MVCERVSMPGGGAAIVCGTSWRKHCACGRPATLLCDWKVPSGTCDADLCSRCSTSPAPNKDLCPTHAAAYVTWKAGRETLQRAAEYAMRARMDDVPTVDVLHHLRNAFGATTWTTGHMMGVATHYLRIGEVLAMSDIDEQGVVAEWSILALAHLKKVGQRT